MDGSNLVAHIMKRAAVSKSALSAASGVSRSLIDDYLKGKSSPSVAQLNRLAAAVGLQLEGVIKVKPPEISPEFVAVLEFGELFPRREPAPLVNISHIWRGGS
jgi:transcriptional regulator with XRE-family HTH domain